MTNESKVTLKTIEVFERGFLGLSNKVAELNKRAARHGMVAIELTIVSEKAFVALYSKVNTNGSRTYSFGGAEPIYCVEISGVEPCIDGWRLGARIEFNATIGNVVRIAPGICDDGSWATYRDVDTFCEHCNSRRRRNDIFVLIGPAGQHKRVGRNCLADFIRSGDAETLARYAEFCEWVSSIDESECEEEFERMGGGSAVATMRLNRYLPVVALMTRKFGWVSRTTAREREDVTATASHAGYFFYGTGRYHAEWIRDNDLRVCPEDEALAALAVEWAKTVKTDGSEYMSIISRIAQAGVVDMRSLAGYAASIIIAYRKACEREALDAERAERAKNAKVKVHYGTVGKRERNVVAKCVGRHSTNGYYGVTTIIRFEVSVSDTEKAILVWFASGDRFNDWEEGADYSLTFTVKGHDDSDKYGKDTKVNRVDGCAA